MASKEPLGEEQCEMTEDRQISIEQDGEVLARASVSVSPDSHDARAEVHVTSGHHPVGTRQRVVEAVHEAVTDDDGQHLTASVPMGDAELVQGLSERLDDVSLRAAGASSIVEGQIKRG